jgi:hypothetical protein
VAVGEWLQVLGPDIYCTGILNFCQDVTDALLCSGIRLKNDIEVE